MFCLFTHRAKIKISSSVKLIHRNVVNLSHLYNEVSILSGPYLKYVHIWQKNMLNL